jgi:hypothetical protein
MTDSATNDTVTRVEAAILAALPSSGGILPPDVTVDQVQADLIVLMRDFRHAPCARIAELVEVALHGAAPGRLTLREAIDLGRRALDEDPTARMELAQCGALGSWQAAQARVASRVPLAPVAA